MFIRCKNKVVESSQLILDGRYEDLLSHYKFNVEEALKKPIFPTLFSSFIRICIFSGTFAQDDQRSYFPAEDHNDIPRQ